MEREGEEEQEKEQEEEEVEEVEKEEEEEEEEEEKEEHVRSELPIDRHLPTSPRKAQKNEDDKTHMCSIATLPA